MRRPGSRDGGHTRRPARANSGGHTCPLSLSLSLLLHRSPPAVAPPCDHLSLSLSLSRSSIQQPSLLSKGRNCSNHLVRPFRAARRVHEYISLDCVKSLITLARTAPPRPWAQRFCSRACRGRQLRHVIHCLRVLARIQYIPVSLREVAHSRQSAEVCTNLIDSPE